MLFALGSPITLVLLLASFLVAITLHGWVQALLARRAGDRTVVAEGRTSLDPRRHLDPFGAVAAAIAGVGWAKPVEPPDRRRRGAMITVLLTGAVVNLVLGIGSLVAFALLSGRSLGGPPSMLLQPAFESTRAAISALPLGERALLLFGLVNLMTGLLSLVPLPPMDGGRLMLGLAPRTVGWQKAEYQLVERNIGVAVLLALLLIPLAGQRALLSYLLDVVAEPLVRLVTGG